MKAPPLLLGSVLVFWGWQTGLLVPGILMGLALESARVVRARWDFSDEDFFRIYNLCLVVLLAAAVYSFTANEGPSELRGFFHNPNFLTQRTAGFATARTAWSVGRWLPMIFFCFALAQSYSAREAVPLPAVSMVLRYRLRMARKLGLPAPASRAVNVSYPFFGLCLFSASMHSADDTTFFWGFCVLVGWALWPHRSPRFAVAWWAVLMGVVMVLSYFGQRGIGQLQGYLGNLNPPWLGAFVRRRFDPTQSQTEIGNLGRIKTSPKIVIRLETANGVPPRRLREATYRTFKGRTLSADLNENDFSRVAETNETTFPLLDKPAPDSVRIACYLPGGKALLPLPRGVARLEHLLAYNVWKSPLGAVLEEGPGLVVFDALYGPGQSVDSPADPEEDCKVPDREKAALDQIVAKLHLKGQSLDQAVRTLTQFFSTQFTYSTWFDQDRSVHRNESPLTRFLLHTRSGHCEYFATAAALLLRDVGIPARYAVGYAVHEGSGTSFVVRQRDGHAWCMVWDDQSRGWREFDPTPPSWVAIDAQRITLAQRLSDLWARITFEISKFRWGQSHLREYLLLSLIPVLLILGFQILFRRRRRLTRERVQVAGSPTTWPGLDSEFYSLERKLAQLGAGRQRSEPLSQWLQRISDDTTLAEIRAPLRTLLMLHYRYRFDPAGLSAADRVRLRDQSNACLEILDRRSLVTSH